MLTLHMSAKTEDDRGGVGFCAMRHQMPQVLQGLGRPWCARLPLIYFLAIKSGLLLPIYVLNSR